MFNPEQPPTTPISEAPQESAVEDNADNSKEQIKQLDAAIQALGEVAELFEKGNLIEMFDDIKDSPQLENLTTQINSTAVKMEAIAKTLTENNSDISGGQIEQLNDAFEVLIDRIDYIKNTNLDENNKLEQLMNIKGQIPDLTQKIELIINELRKKDKQTV